MKKIVVLLLIFAFVFSPLFSAGLLENPNIIQLPWNKDSKITQEDLDNLKTTQKVLAPTQDKDLTISVKREDLQKKSETKSNGEVVESTFSDEEVEEIIENIAALQEEIQKGEQNFSEIVVQNAKNELLIDEVQEENENLQETTNNIVKQNNDLLVENEKIKTENLDFRAKLKDDMFKVRFGALCDYKALDDLNVGVFTGIRVGDFTADIGVKVDLFDTIANPMGLINIGNYTVTASVAYEF